MTNQAHAGPCRDDCFQQIDRFSGAEYRKFPTFELAQGWLEEAEASPNESASIKRPLKDTQYYAVARGVVPGVYTDWDACAKQTDGFSGALFKRFRSEADAAAFVRNHGPAAMAESPAPLARRPASEPKQCALVCKGDYTVVYTDGSSLSNGQRAARAGFGVFWGYNHPWNVAAGMPGPVTARLSNPKLWMADGNKHTSKHTNTH